MKRVLFFLSVIIAFHSCYEIPDKSNVFIESSPKSCVPQKTDTETHQMVLELATLAEKRNPEHNPFLNKKRAEFYYKQGEKGSYDEQFANWYRYCQETLRSGESQTCINSIISVLEQIGKPYDEIIDKNAQSIFELLGLAYLRLGEQENCQNNHTAQSCILPLQKEGQHQLKNGSRHAIEIFSLLQDKFPRPKYKWLLNIAYMTLGEYDQNIPASYKIDFPSKKEQAAFPAFKEIAMTVGLAHNDLAGGVCIDDFDNDGFLDIFITSYNMEGNVQLFMNNGKGGFNNTTIDAGLKGIVGGLNCIQADYDNDGLKDILILRGAWLGKDGKLPNSLLKNMGSGKFQDVTYSSRLLSYHPTQTAAWGDFNNDGHLDLFIGNETTAMDSHSCELFQNNGDGTFSEVAAKYGLGNVLAFVKGVSWGDINNDGWPDLYISTMRGENLLFKNNRGTFVEIGMKAGVNKPFYSFPCWFWDVNNDGLQDIFVSGYDGRFLSDLEEEFVRELQEEEVTSEKPRLYINNGDETFTESASSFGISKTMFAMGTNFGDLDNDGFLDFYVGTGAPSFSTIVPNRMFRNVDGKRFEEVTSAGNFGHIQKGHGISFADLDRDGDQDIYSVMGGAFEGDNFTNILYENPISTNNWVVFELIGVTTNRSAIGTVLELEIGDNRKIYHTIGTGGSFGSNSLQAEIGVGASKQIDKLTINWQNGEKQIFLNIAVNEKYAITEGLLSLEKMSYSYKAFKKAESKHHHH